MITPRRTNSQYPSKLLRRMWAVNEIEETSINRVIPHLGFCTRRHLCHRIRDLKKALEQQNAKNVRAMTASHIV